MSKNTIINIAKGAFTIAFVFLLFRIVDLRVITDLYSRLSLRVITVGFLLYFAINIIRSVRFKILLDKKVNIFRLLMVVLVHGFYNRVLPFRLGEGTFPYYMKQIENVNIGDSMVCVIVVRIFDLLSTALIFFSFYLISQSNNLYMDIFYVLIMLFLCLIFFPVVFWITDKIIPRLKGVHNYKIYYFLENIIQLKKEKLNLVNNIILLILSIINWIILFIIFQLLLEKFKIIIPFQDVILAGSFSNLSSILPVSSFGNFGTMELGWSVVLLGLGYGKQEAILSGFSINLFTFTSIATLGILGLFQLRLLKKRKGEIKNDAG